METPSFRAGRTSTRSSKVRDPTLQTRKIHKARSVAVIMGYGCLGHNLYAAMGSISSGSDISEGDGVYLWFALEFLQLDNRLLKVLEPEPVSDA